MPSEISCPCCDSPMRPHLHDGVELDLCRACGGLWFDGGELREVIGRTLETKGSQPQYRACPRCKTEMKRVLIGKVGAEHCDACDGYFLDKGELEQILEAQKRRVAQVAAAEAPKDFDCKKCGGHFPMEQAYAVPGGHVCEKCAGGLATRNGPPGRLEMWLSSFVDNISADIRDYMYHHHH